MWNKYFCENLLFFIKSFILVDFTSGRCKFHSHNYFSFGKLGFSNQNQLEFLYTLQCGTKNTIFWYFYKTVQTLCKKFPTTFMKSCPTFFCNFSTKSLYWTKFWSSWESRKSFHMAQNWYWYLMQKYPTIINPACENRYYLNKIKPLQKKLP